MHRYLLHPINFLFLTAALCAIPPPGFGQSEEQTIVDKAWDLCDREDYAGCLKELNSLPFESGTPRAGAYYLLGRCQYEVGDYKASIESFGISLKKDPNMTEVYYDRGYAYVANLQYKEAAADFEMSLRKSSARKDGKSFMHHLATNYANCLGQRGEWEKALVYLEKYRNKDAGLLHVLAYLTSVHKNDHDHAILFWEQALQLEPTHVLSLENLSIEYSEVGDYNMAFYHVEKLIEYYPDHGRGYYLKAVYLEEMGEDGDAELYYQMARDKGYDPDESVDE